MPNCQWEYLNNSPDGEANAELANYPIIGATWVCFVLACFLYFQIVMLSFGGGDALAMKSRMKEFLSCAAKARR